MVFSNGVCAPMGRYPNTGWLTYQSETVSGLNITVTSSSLSGTPNWAGAEIFIYGNRYAFDKAPIASQSGGTLAFTSVNQMVYDKKNPKFIIQNDPRTLDVANEWYYNPSTKKLRIYSTSTPANVQISTVDNLVYISGYNYITFDNISFLNLT